MSNLSEYIQALNPQGYVNNREITNLPGHLLVKGSKNCIIVTKEKTVSRKGYSLVGAAKTKNKGHKSSFDWETSGDGAGEVVRNVRLNDAGELEVWYLGSWRLFKTYAAGTRANFCSWWNATELIDVMLFVIGGATVQHWGGGIAEIASFTSTTVTLKYNVTGTGIAFVAASRTITDSNNGFVVAGFQAGDEIIVEGTASNDGRYIIKTVAAGVLTLSDDDTLVNESAGSTFTVKRPGATWAEKRFLTANTYGTRKVYINGTEYAYTGGETTPTLTGITGLAGVSAGDLAIQSVISSAPSHLQDLKLDLISMMNNYVFYGSTTSRAHTISKSTDFTDFTFTSPLRVPGEGFDMVTDSPPTAYVPDEDVMWISGRKDDWYKVMFTLSSTGGAETIQVKKLKTATGQAARSQAVIINIKNAVAFLSFEPTLDTLGNVPNLLNVATAVPLSWDIKDDLLIYDLTDAHGLFYQNQIFIALPAEGIVIIYDTQMKLWQPPQFLPVGRLALIDIDGDGTQVLCGHSSFGNETYKLFDGYNDNGSIFRVEMRFGYDNFGTRFTQKSFDEAATELYASQNTKVTNQVVYDYKGATGIREFEIDGADEAIRFAPVVGVGLGEDPLGRDPLGSLASPLDDLSKIRVVDTTTVLDFFERQRAFISESPDVRFAVIAYGENVEIADNIPASIKR